MGAGTRREEEKLCPLCIEALDPTEKTYFPCPCGYQVCLFCLDRLKKEYGSRCPGCRTGYGSDTNPCAKRAPSSSTAATPASTSSRSSSPVVAPAASAAAPVAQAPVSAAGLTPLEQARQMHRAAQQARQQAARQAAAAQQASQAAATQPLASSQPQQLQQQQQQQQPRAATPQPPPQQQAQLPLPLPSLHDSTVRPATSLASARSACANKQPREPIGSRTLSASAALDTAALQPAQWLGPGGGFASAGGGAGNNASGMPCSSGEVSASNGGRSAANGVLCSGSGGSPWGNGLAGPAAAAPTPAPPRRTASPLRPLPLEGGPVVAADPGAEADLAAARLAVQCGQLSASDAAWNLLSARASVRAG